ncbi:hypothetical protein CRYUN_Cryun31cG0090000 [Craigia yunnanensis]
MATTDEKDERRRRRRMSEKGLNRMSHITSGRAQSISSSSLPPLLDHDHHQPPQSHLLDQTNDAKKESFDAESEGARDEKRKIEGRGFNRTSRFTSQSNPLILDHQTLFSNDHQAPQTYFSDQISAGPVGVGKASTSSYLKHGGIHEISSVNSLYVGGQAELKMQKLGIDRDAISALVVGERDKPLNNAESLQKPCGNQPNFFSSKRLNSCIIASERTRSFCALLIALFVLLSYIDYPLLGMNIVRSESIVASRPLYIISLTDLTVVLGRMCLDKKGDSEEAEEENARSQNNRQNWKGAVKLLDRGLVVYQTIRALFIDYSIYAVVVICGLSLI